MALARLLQVTPREALTLLSEPRVLPAEFDATRAESACEALRKHGVEVATLDVPPSTSRCTAHPSLTGDAPCDDCRTLVCPLCLPLCRTCKARSEKATQWKRLRVGVLLTLLLGIAAWAALRQRKLDRRTEWQRPLRVSVVLVSNEPVSDDVTAAWARGLENLDAWFQGEATRLGLPLERPVHFELAPNAVIAEVPSPPADGSGNWHDAIALRSKLKSLAEQGHPGLFDARLLVALRQNEARRVEGLGEAGGTIGLIDGNAGDTELALELIALAHELLHCLGAMDAYDAQGHALPRGMVEPERGYPQSFAEVMVGEVPVTPSEGRLPKSLEEVRIGDETAREVGWLK
jgi:hypothetical protein